MSSYPSSQHSISKSPLTNWSNRHQPWRHQWREGDFSSTSSRQRLPSTSSSSSTSSSPSTITSSSSSSELCRPHAKNGRRFAPSSGRPGSSRYNSSQSVRPSSYKGGYESSSPRSGSGRYNTTRPYVKDGRRSELLARRSRSRRHNTHTARSVRPSSRKGRSGRVRRRLAASQRGKKPRAETSKAFINSQLDHYSSLAVQKNHRHSQWDFTTGEEITISDVVSDFGGDRLSSFANTDNGRSKLTRMWDTASEFTHRIKTKDVNRDKFTVGKRYSINTSGYSEDVTCAAIFTDMLRREERDGTLFSDNWRTAQVTMEDKDGNSTMKKVWAENGDTGRKPWTFTYAK
nr:uncharacterized protein CI109_005333 [Kwoniella shandongensis]KAA5526376.1 hypothetical protein CI109_005333 [Kwoniella shandongensis]